MKKIINYLVASKFFQKSKGFIIGRLKRILADQNLKAIPIFFPGTKKDLELIEKAKKEVTFGIGDLEAFQIMMAVRKTRKVPGDIAEVGVYKGGSAKLICETRDPGKSVILFDTFAGLPDVSAHDDSKHFHKGDYLGTLAEVRQYLSSYSNVNFVAGLFPQSTSGVEERSYSFVHLDVDLYESTLDGLKYFYGRMNRGGVIISHDYLTTTGVKKAFDDFFADKPEPILEFMGSSQAMVVKV
jgi:hypothetical protein